MMTNSFNFDLFIFIKQMGIQNIVRIIFKQSICFDSIEKEKKKKRETTKHRKRERYYPVTIYPFMPERH